MGETQTAVQQVVTFIQDEISNMDKAAESLMAEHQDEGDAVQEQVQRFIDGCNIFICYGIRNLSLRYFFYQRLLILFIWNVIYLPAIS